MSKLTNLTKDNFDQEVSETSGTVVVEFGDDWCGPCKAMAPVLEQFQASADGQYKVFAVDIDDEVELTQKYGVRSVPTVIVFKAGKVSKSGVGAMSRAALTKLLE